MKYSELHNFTYDELYHFAHSDLELAVPQLIERLRDNNTPVPLQTQEKLTAMYKEIIKSRETSLGSSVDKNKIRLPKPTLKTWVGISAVVSDLWGMYWVMPEDARQHINNFFVSVWHSINT